MSVMVPYGNGKAVCVHTMKAYEGVEVLHSTHS
jgi:hypothetical protein